MLSNAIEHMTDIAAHIFTEENLEIAVHGNASKFPLIQMKIEMMLNALKNHNSMYSEKQSPIIMLEDMK